MISSRRKFVKDSVKLAAMISLPLPAWSAENIKPIKFGAIADVHNDLIPDGLTRLEAFIQDASQRDLDFIIQLGDFCIPRAENRSFMEAFDAYPGEKHHVLGNHDMDLGFTREQAVEFWSMKARYYSFDRQGVHFVILDGNDPNPQPFEGYHRYIGQEQLQWLKNDLEQTTDPTVIFSHQTLENEDGGVANMTEVRELLERINQKAGHTKVIACLCGHHHTDYHTQINGIYYIQINSASYRWVGEDYRVKRYSEELHQKYKWLDHMIPYKDPLFTFITLDPEGYLSIESKQSSFIGPGPDQIGMPTRPENDPIVPFISGKELKCS
jgi:3',5'-cyclic AMP phosphodiesterase CpdA